MIDHLNYNGYIVNSFSLEKIKNTNGGRYITNYLEQNIAFYDKKDDAYPLAYKVDFELKAFDGSEEDANNLAYILKVNFDINFISSNQHNEDYDNLFKEYGWLIKNYTYMATKSIVENIIKNTQLDGMRLPNF